MRKQALFLLFSVVVCANDPISLDQYHARRAELRKSLEGAIVLFGRVEGRDEVMRNSQEKNFYYLTGLNDPGAIVILTQKEEILFVPRRNDRREIYNGRRVAPGDADAQLKTGFDNVQGTEKFESALARAIESGPIVSA